MKKPRTGVTNKYEFIKLAKRYADITIEEIEVVETSMIHIKEWLRFEPYGVLIAEKLTGFGSGNCTLCKSTLVGSCKECYWLVSTGEGCAIHYTYYDIYNAKNKHELKTAMNIRSEYMYSVNVKLNKEKITNESNKNNRIRS